MMPNLSGAALCCRNSFELSLLAKATLILLAGLAVTALARTARASARHLVIATSFAALVALPLLIAVRAGDGDRRAGRSAQTPSSRAQRQRRGRPHGGAERGRSRRPAPPQRALPGLSLAQWARVVWVAGAIAFLIPVASALWRLSMIRRTGLPVAWHRAELARLADARGVSLPVELLEHEAVPGPMTFGISRPVIVLPLDAREWSEAELRRALMHEIEHIQRGDWLMQIVARTVAAFYWFHPLVWTAWRRLCLEAERSCDDAVVHQRGAHRLRRTARHAGAAHVGDARAADARHGEPQRSVDARDRGARRSPAPRPRRLRARGRHRRGRGARGDDRRAGARGRRATDRRRRQRLPRSRSDRASSSAAGERASRARSIASSTKRRKTAISTA